MKPHVLSLAPFAVAAMLAFQGSAHAASAAATASSGSAPAASHAAATRVASTEPAGTLQRNKMKSCNAEARQKNVHGADRRAFMKQCLSKAAPAS